MQVFGRSIFEIETGSPEMAKWLCPESLLRARGVFPAYGGRKSPIVQLGYTTSHTMPDGGVSCHSHMLWRCHLFKNLPQKAWGEEGGTHAWYLVRRDR